MHILKKIEWCSRKFEHSIKLVAILVASIFTLNQYFSHLEEGQVKATLEFYKRLSSNPLFSVRMELNEAWESKWPLISAKFSKSKTEQEATLQLKLWKAEVVNFISENKLSSGTAELFDYYNALQICVETKICDKATAESLLKTSGVEFIQNNCAYIAHMRFDRKDDDFGEKAVSFASSACNPKIYE